MKYFSGLIFTGFGPLDLLLHNPTEEKVRKKMNFLDPHFQFWNLSSIKHPSSIINSNTTMRRHVVFWRSWYLRPLIPRNKITTNIKVGKYQNKKQNSTAGKMRTFCFVNMFSLLLYITLPIRNSFFRNLKHFGPIAKLLKGFYPNQRFAMLYGISGVYRWNFFDRFPSFHSHVNIVESYLIFGRHSNTDFLSKTGDIKCTLNAVNDNTLPLHRSLDLILAKSGQYDTILGKEHH